jgi:putative SOS response-associated peptidase YedK
MQQRRCLVVANGFYEWQPTGQGAMKQPWLFQLADEGVFAMAGLWETWQPPQAGDSPLETFTILTTKANTRVAPVHGRMPVILGPAQHASWLNEATCDAATLASMLEHIDVGLPFDAAAMKGRVVSRYVNRPANDDPRCLEDPEDLAQGTLFG